MPREAVLFLCLLLITWLFLRDRKLRPMETCGVWIPLLWIMVIGSRGSSYWFSLEIDPELSAAAFLEGSPVDRNIYLFLIISGAIVVWKRKPDLGKLFNSNRWLFAFFLYCGVSIVWSRYPFPSFKGWIKDLGNLIMILIMMTESNPVTAVKAVFARYTYFAVPLSLVLIKWFPDLGSYYTVATGEISYCGVTTNKNEFGEILVVCGLFLIHDLIHKKQEGLSKAGKTDLAVRIALLVTVVWLLSVAHSSTAIACFSLGTTILLFMQLPIFKRQAMHLGLYSMAFIMMFLVLNSFAAVTAFLVEMLGRDMTFTGRTYIWSSLLREPVNPVVGTGYHSFWLPPGVMERYGYINQAHNGYLETFLNGGVIGACLLLSMIISVGAKIKKLIQENDPFASLYLAILVVGVLYNMTEAMFNRLSLMWLVFLLASFEFRATVAVAETVRPVTRGQVLRPQGSIRCVNGR